MALELVLIDATTSGIALGILIIFFRWFHHGNR